MAEAWYLRDCFKVCCCWGMVIKVQCVTPTTTQDIVLQVPSYNYYKGIGYSVSKLVSKIL